MTHLEAVPFFSEDIRIGDVLGTVNLSVQQCKGKTIGELAGVNRASLFRMKPTADQTHAPLLLVVYPNGSRYAHSVVFVEA